MAAFREEVAKSKHIVVLTGAGASAESGVPTFRGAGGLWRKWNAQVCITFYPHQCSGPANYQNWEFFS